MSNVYVTSKKIKTVQTSVSSKQITLPTITVSWEFFTFQLQHPPLPFILSTQVLTILAEPVLVLIYLPYSSISVYPPPLWTCVVCEGTLSVCVTMATFQIRISTWLHGFETWSTRFCWNRCEYFSFAEKTQNKNLNYAWKDLRMIGYYTDNRKW